jgi:hypothetical protein
MRIDDLNSRLRRGAARVAGRQRQMRYSNACRRRKEPATAA